MPNTAMIFGAATSDNVNCGSDSSLDGFTEHSLCTWIYVTNLAPSPAVRMIATKETSFAAGFEKEWTIRSGGQIECVTRCATTNAAARTTNSAGNILTVNKWWFIAHTLDVNKVPRIYLGDLVTNAYEPTYVTQNTGVGTINDDSAASFRIGNAADTARSLIGSMPYLAYFNRTLSLSEIRSWQYQPSAKLRGCHGFWQLGRSGGGTQHDYSGYNNHGTVTGATLQSGPSLPDYNKEEDWAFQIVGENACQRRGRKILNHFLVR